MIIDPIEWVSTTLRAPAGGLNALLPAVPRAAGEPAPPPCRIVDENTDDWVVRGAITREFLLDQWQDAQPIVIVRLHRLDGGNRMQLLPEFEQADPTTMPIEIIYAARRVEQPGVTVPTATLKRWARQSIRTALRVLARQFESSMTAHEQHGCVMSLSSAGVLLGSEYVETTGDVVTDFAVLPLRVMDRWALGL